MAANHPAKVSVITIDLSISKPNLSFPATVSKENRISLETITKNLSKVRHSIDSSGPKMRNSSANRPPS